MIRTLALILALSSVAACGKKAAPVSPANKATTENAPGGGAADESAPKDESKPDDADDAQKMGADPCDGGE